LKKIIAIGLILALCLFITACSASNESAPVESESPVDTSQVTATLPQPQSPSYTPQEDEEEPKESEPESQPTLDSRPAVPTGLQVVRSSDTTAVVSWNAVSGASSYEAQFHSPSTNNVWVRDTEYSSGTAYTITQLVNTRVYGFRVRAVNAAGTSDWLEISYTHNQGETNSGTLSAAPTTITIKGITYSTSLTELDLSSQNLTNSDIEPLRHMTNLTKLFLGFNQISNISPISGLTSLETLFLWHNQISDISALSRLTNLTQLALNNNQISNINALSGLNNLTWLRMDFNQISDVSPLSGLTKLTQIFLDANNISDVSVLSGLTNLTDLSLYDNPRISESQIEELRAALPNCDISDAIMRANPVTGKPVIYLYPQRTQDVSVKLDFDGVLTYTFPTYRNGWNVTASPDGRMINKSDNSIHYYLFWEGVPNFNNWDFSEGFVVKGDEVERFLLDRLPLLGLTPREYNDFITYWVPQMISNEYNLVTFATTQYEELAQLTVFPVPDTMIIVHMVWKPIPAPVVVREQVLPHAPRRNGFTLVEWGGTRAS